MAKVGRSSSRTPYKHWVLNSHLGKICGALSTGRVPAVAKPLLCIDLCAGDGSRSAEYECSPYIIMKHCEWLQRSGSGCTAKSVFIEKDESTFEVLIGNKDRFHEDGGFRSRWITQKNSPGVLHDNSFHNMDARELVIEPSCRNQAIFINCDPNSIADLPFAKSLGDSLTPMTTMTLTLGCNTGGLKRMPRDRREEWFDYLSVLIDMMPTWHDALLVEVVNDASQWAYLTRLPEKWSRDVAAACKRYGDKHFTPHGVNVASYRDDQNTFQEICNRLFLTKKEREASCVTN